MAEEMSSEELFDAYVGQPRLGDRVYACGTLGSMAAGFAAGAFVGYQRAVRGEDATPIDELVQNTLVVAPTLIGALVLSVAERVFPSGLSEVIRLQCDNNYGRARAEPTSEGKTVLYAASAVSSAATSIPVRTALMVIPATGLGAMCGYVTGHLAKN